MKRFVILLLSLFVCSCSLQKEGNTITRESVEVETISLGAKKTDSKPIILVNNKQENLYIGERNYDFGVEAYSDNGDVSITYDDSEVNYESQGTYLVKIIANDLYSSSEDCVKLSLKIKPAYPISIGNGLGGANEKGYLPAYISCWNRYFNSPDELVYYALHTEGNAEGNTLMQDIAARYSNMSVEEWNAAVRRQRGY